MISEKGKIRLKLLIKNFVLFLISFACAVLNFFYEGGFEVSASDESAIDAMEFNLQGENTLDGSVFLRFDPDFQNLASLRPVADVKTTILEMESGRLWGNFSLSSNKSNIIVGGEVVLIPRRAVFDLTFVEGKLDLVVIEGDVYLGFLSEGGQLVDYVDELDENFFVNRLVVPRGSQISFSFGQLDSVIDQLLYSKLVKELKLFAISEEKLVTEWFTQNLRQDEKFKESLQQDFISRTIRNGIALRSDFLHKMAYFAQDNFAFFPDKRVYFLYDRLFGHFDNALYYYSALDLVEAQSASADFDVAWSSLSPELKTNFYYYEIFDNYLDNLSFFDKEDSLYPAYLNLLAKKFGEGRDMLEVINDFWFEVYKNMDGGSDFAELAFDEYYKFLKLFLQRFEGDSDMKFFLSYQNQLLENLLMKYPQFYGDKYFEVKSVLEKRLLDTYDEGQIKSELRQYFVAAKITFMKRLQTFFFDDKVTIEESKKILARLVEESQFFLEGEKSDLAIFTLFQSELDELSTFGGYLSSPEYNGSSIYGTTHRERYETYLEESEYVWSFIDLRRELLGDSIPQDEEEVSNVATEVRDALIGAEDLSDLNIEDVTASNQRFVSIEAVIGGYPFKASYDRYTDTLKDVYVYDQLVTDRAVKIGSLLSLLQNKFADLAPIESPEVQSDFTEETNAERIAKIYIANTLGDSGIEVEVENISVVSKGRESIYRIKNAEMEEFADVVINFDYFTSLEEIGNILLLVDGVPKSISGEYDLATLKMLVEARGDISSILTEGNGVDRSGVPVDSGVSR